jgi:hypothetical protein
MAGQQYQNLSNRDTRTVDIRLRKIRKKWSVSLYHSFITYDIHLCCVCVPDFGYWVSIQILCLRFRLYCSNKQLLLLNSVFFSVARLNSVLVSHQTMRKKSLWMCTYLDHWLDELALKLISIFLNDLFWKTFGLLANFIILAWGIQAYSSSKRWLCVQQQAVTMWSSKLQSSSDDMTYMCSNMGGSPLEFWALKIKFTAGHK